MKQFLRKHRAVLFMVGAVALAKIFDIELPPYLFLLSLVDNFDSYTDGDLNGQGSWTAHVDFDVQGTTVQAGTKAVQLSIATGLERTGTKAFTGQTSGSQVVYVRKNNVNQAEAECSLKLFEGASIRFLIKFVGSKTQYLSSAPAWVDVTTGLSADTWYRLEAEWRSADKYVRYRAGVSDADPGTFTDWVAPYSSWTTNLNTVQIYGYTGGTGTTTFYWDSYSDPNAGSTSPSISPSASPSVSPSASPSLSPSISPSVSPSVSPSPSPGWTDYTRGDEASLPAGILDLETNYTAQDIIDVATKDDVRVGQTATSEYAIHQFKEYAGATDSCVLEWEGQTNCSPTLSTVYLQIFNRDTPAWETVDTDNSSAEDTDFILTASIPDLTNYKDASSTIACRVWQLDI